MFTPFETSIGAILLHQATSTLLFQNGWVLGASSLMHRFLSKPTRETTSFFIGMALSSLPLKIFLPQLETSYPAVSMTLQAALVTAGVGALVGLGTKMSNGCTSGHMLCGLSRLSGRSAVAVATFFSTALITHHLVHPSLHTTACPPGTQCYLPSYPSSTTTALLLALTAVTILATKTVPQIIANATASELNTKSEAPARLATQFFAGFEFGLGLHVSQMASPAKVLSFLSFPKRDAWDPSLGLVMLFGVLPNVIEIQARSFTKPPTFNTRFELSDRSVKDVDWYFVVGAALFGVGWGLTGTCPGPAVLRAFAQPAWGLFWMGGFWLGGKVVAS